MKSGKIWGNTELIHANGVLEFHRIEFKAGYKCSEHEHCYKWNGFFVESGKMIVRVWQDGEQQGLRRGKGAQRKVAGEDEHRARGKREPQSERVRESGNEAEALAVYGEGRPGIDGV